MHLSVQSLDDGSEIRENGQRFELSLLPGTYNVDLSVPEVFHRDRRRVTIGEAEELTLSVLPSRFRFS